MSVHMMGGLASPKSDNDLKILADHAVRKGVKFDTPAVGLGLDPSGEGADEQSGRGQFVGHHLKVMAP